MKKSCNNDIIVISTKGGIFLNDYRFGNFLYELRTEKGLSQSQMGELLGVTNKAVSKWENGSAKPNTALIPKIAEILGVTVEELFACKRLEKDREFEKLKNHLFLQKKKYSILSSVFLSLIITLPFLLIEFICVVMGFQLPDDILGPLGSVFFIVAFIISITAYAIYHKSFRHSLSPSEPLYSPKFLALLKNGIIISLITCLSILTLILPIYLLILRLTTDFLPADIFLSITVLIFLIFLGALICLANIKRLLKIKFSQSMQKNTHRICFSELPIWAKICYVAVIVLFPIIVNIQILGFFNNDLLPIKILSVTIWFGCELAIIIYSLKRK